MSRSKAFDLDYEARKYLMGKVWVGGWRGSWSTPVEWVDGAGEPRLLGLGYWKTTLHGPGGFVKTLYTPSTLRIVVGRDWRPGR